MTHKQQEPQFGLPCSSFDLDTIRTLAYPGSDMILCQYRLSLFGTGRYGRIDNSEQENNLYSELLKKLFLQTIFR